MTAGDSYKLSPQRWYILCLFTVFACFQTKFWSTFSPLYKEMQEGFDWKETEISMIVNLGNIFYAVSVFPTTWFFEKFGVRSTVLVISSLVGIAGILRVIGVLVNEGFLYYCYAASIINGLPGSIVMAIPPSISAAWFPPNERTTATAIAIAGTSFGNGVAYLLGPILVPMETNKELHDAVYNSTIIEDIQRRTKWYMIGDACVAATFVFLFWLYFPSKPKTPPCPSSVEERTEYIDGLKKLMRNPPALISIFSYTISQGIQGAWWGVMALTFDQVGFTDRTIGRIGFWATVATVGTTVVAALVTDKVRGHMKLTIAGILLVSSMFHLWLCLICLEVIKVVYWQAYFATIGLIFCII